MATPTIPTIPTGASLETVWHRAVYTERRLLRSKLAADLAPERVNERETVSVKDY